MINNVVLSHHAQRDLKKVPIHILRKFLTWVQAVELRGLYEVRRIPGYHDEPLHGDRKGQRSIRLNKAYRAFYIVKSSGLIEFVSVEEINKHEY